jgi:lipoic acid synthetase
MPGRLSDRHAVKALLRRASLSTVCEQARCPNIRECFGCGTATFLVLGEVCTRGCRFCAVARGSAPPPPDPDEPARLAEAVAALGLAHVVVTSVTRDDLPDGGAGHFVACARAVRVRCPGTTLELLVPDFAGREASLDEVLAARPEVLDHNLETVPRLYPRVRPGADFGRSWRLLARAAGARGVVKTGFMLGLGETDEEILELLAGLAPLGCQIVTLGQYLRPGRASLAVEREVGEASFERFRQAGRELGLQVVAGSLVRSSYRAREALADHLLGGAPD